MQPTSSLFTEKLRQSHIIAAECDLIWPGVTDDADAINVPIEAGSITIDRTAQNRRSGSITIPWSLQADLGVDLRTLPLGGYALVYRGMRFGDGSIELVLLGRLRVESVSWDTQAASASLELADRQAQIRDEPFTVPYAAAGQTAAQAATGIVRQVFGSAISYLTPYNPAGVLGDITYTGQRTDALADLEQAFAAETYFNANGDFVFAAKPSGGDPVVWTVDASANGVMINASENLDRTGVYNGVLVTGQPEADQPPISALAIYDAAGSPIRWGGPFGKVAMLADSMTATTTDQCLATAQSLLNLRLKQTRNLTLTAAPNPALEAGDTIEVVFPDGRTETHLVDATTINLGTDAQQIITRTMFAPSSSGRVGAAAWAELHDARLVG
jgi:hypothetical protein